MLRQVAGSRKESFRCLPGPVKLPEGGIPGEEDEMRKTRQDKTGEGNPTRIAPIINCICPLGGSVFATQSLLDWTSGSGVACDMYYCVHSIGRVIHDNTYRRDSSAR